MGIDTDLFANPVPDYLQCQVCLDALYEPYSFCREEHLACADCVRAIVHHPGQRAPLLCPQCRGPANPTPSKGFSRIINGLDVRCTYSRDKGDCTWTGTAGGFKAHVRECPHRPQPCKHRQAGCRFEGAPRALRDHYAKDCQCETMRCPRQGCGLHYVRATAMIHDDICTYYKCKVPTCQTLTTKRHLPRHEVACLAESRRYLAQTRELAVALERIQQMEAERRARLLEPLAVVEQEPTDTKPVVSPPATRSADQEAGPSGEPSAKRTKVAPQLGSPRQSSSPPLPKLLDAQREEGVAFGGAAGPEPPETYVGPKRKRELAIKLITLEGEQRQAMLQMIAPFFPPGTVETVEINVEKLDQTTLSALYRRFCLANSRAE